MNDFAERVVTPLENDDEQALEATLRPRSLAEYIGQQAMYTLRADIFGRLQQLSLSFFDRNPVGRLLTRVTSDIEALNEMFTSGVVTIFGDVFTVAFIMAAMMAMDLELALVTFAVLPLVFVAAWIFRRRVREAYRDIRVRLARINAFLQERISGVRVVQLFRQETPTRERFGEINDDSVQLETCRAYFPSPPWPTMPIRATSA